MQKIIWKKTPDLNEINQLHRKTIHHSLGIEFCNYGNDFIEATMPIDERTHQVFGYLHGGASVVLAESLGSIGSVYATGIEECFGIEINASHLQSTRHGMVLGRATAMRIGHKLQVWDIDIIQNNILICKSRLTVYAKTKK